MHQCLEKSELILFEFSLLFFSPEILYWMDIWMCIVDPEDIEKWKRGFMAKDSYANKSSKYAQNLSSNRNNQTQAREKTLTESECSNNHGHFHRDHCCLHHTLIPNRELTKARQQQRHGVYCGENMSVTSVLKPAKFQSFFGGAMKKKVNHFQINILASYQWLNVVETTLLLCYATKSKFDRSQYRKTWTFQSLSPK